MQIERCWELGYPATFRPLRDRRIGLVALAGIDTGLVGRDRPGVRAPAAPGVGRLPRSASR